MLTFDGAGAYAFADELRALAAPYFKVNLLQLRQAVVRGMGLGTVAGWELRMRQDPQWRAESFDYVAFAERLADLTGSWETAQALWSLAIGVRLDMAITKYPLVRQRVEKYTDVPYEITARLLNVDPLIVASDPFILLPEFYSGKGVEKFRVDSAHWHRAPLEKAGMRPADRATKRNTRVAKLKDATWTGGLFVYWPDDQQDDANCLRNVTAALSRSLLSAACPGLHCEIYHPEGYDEGAYRIVIRLSPLIIKAIALFSLPFQVPRSQGWNLVMEHANIDHAAAHRGGDVGGKFVDGLWLCDLYPQGDPSKPRTDLNKVKSGLLNAIYQQLERQGVRFVEPLAPSQDGKFVSEDRHGAGVPPKITQEIVMNTANEILDATRQLHSLTIGWDDLATKAQYDLIRTKAQKVAEVGTEEEKLAALDLVNGIVEEVKSQLA